MARSHLETVEIQKKKKLERLVSSPGGYSWQFLVGVCGPVLQILILFQTKNVIFHIRFQTWPLGRNYVVVT